jgi:hypothetical protein
VIVARGFPAWPRFGAVNRRRGRAAQQLDRLDIVGVHIGKAIHRIVLLLTEALVGRAPGDAE